MVMKERTEIVYILSLLHHEVTSFTGSSSGTSSGNGLKNADERAVIFVKRNSYFASGLIE